ncbi:DUF3078 domain-containing protein [candidate division KSB1 bacterium]|nr:DUF3078 domain-containing protein [candidate division KSB1 bacterium]
MKKFFFIYLMVSLCWINVIFAQDEKAAEVKYGWQRELVGGVNLSQSSFDNWAQGGENSLAWQVNLNGKFVNEQQKTNWSNSGKFVLGSTKSGDQESRKSIDEIKLESVLTYKVHLYVNPYIAATAETQSLPGYHYGDGSQKTQMSDFLDPGYIRESFGIGFQPNDIVKTRLGAAMKQTLTNDYPKPYADDLETVKIEKTKNEFGAESVTDLDWKLAENSLFTSKLELFSTMKAFDEVDVNWDNILTTKISKYFNVNFNFKLYYDKDISAKRQLNQAIALGIMYSFL